LKTQQSSVILHVLDVCLSKTRAGKSHNYRVLVFEKLHFQNVFRPNEKRKAGVFKFFLFEERFQKAPFW